MRRDEVQELFSMNLAKYGGKVESVLRIAFSWSVLWFYLVNVVVVTATAHFG